MLKQIGVIAASAVLATVSAHAADYNIITQPSPIAYAPVTDWTGFYAGIFGGVGAGDFDIDLPGGPIAINSNARGGLIGFQLGADYQIQSFVIGAVVDIAWSGIAGDSTVTAPPAGSLSYTSNLDYLGTLRARAGFLPTDDLLAYVHGGLAYGRTSPAMSVNGVAAPGIVAADRWGYTIGAGLEYAVTENISLQTEYAYTDLGNRSVSNGTIVGGANESFSAHTIRAGVNFRF